MRVLALLAALLFAFSVSAAPKAPKGPRDVVLEINDSIEGMMLLEIGGKVEQAKKDHARHLTVIINSPGGEIRAGMALIRTIVDSKIPTTCVVGDLAASMAAIILESPACQERIVHAQSVVMFHDGAGSREGHQRQLDNGVRSMAAWNKWAAHVVTARTAWSYKWYWQHVVEEGQEIWLVGSETLGPRVADKVLPVGRAYVPPK